MTLTAQIAADHLTQIKRGVLAALAECEQAEAHDDCSVRLLARIQRGRWEEVQEELRFFERVEEAVV